jgi:hypothetical protein
METPLDGFEGRLGVTQDRSTSKASRAQEIRVKR